MKKLVLIRHARADKNPDIPDIDQTLSETGKSVADEMAHNLHEKNDRPDLIISSPARRAKETAKIFAKAFNYADEIVIKDALYGSYNIESFLNIISEIDNNNDVVFLFGHNPKTSELTAVLVSGFKTSMKAGSVAAVELDLTDWNEVVPGCGNMQFYASP